MAFSRVLYMAMRCGGCGRGGLAVVHDNGQVHDGLLEDFFPACVGNAKIPDDVPQDIQKEYREGETCAAYGAYRAGSALMRSVLEKVLKASGYTKGNLKEKIIAIATDGLITENRRDRAHENRELGNDVLHDDWRLVTPDEFEAAHHYTQRILEDLYDDRPSVEAKLKSLKRIP